MEKEIKHIPVLLEEVIKTFSYLDDGFFVDATLGAGGHSIALMTKTKSFDKQRASCQVLKFIGIDRDESALELAKKNVTAVGMDDQFIFVHDNFRNIKNILANLDVNQISGALIDLGVSSMQLDQKERGFSFEEPTARLDMRMDQSQGKSAMTIVNSYDQSEIENILRDLGEERFARLIAKNITQARKIKPIETVGELLSVIERSIPAKARYASKKHYATNTFRALRIAVNEELHGLEKVIDDFVELLAPADRLAIITFHSSEDRIVKNEFRRLENPCTCPADLPTCVCGAKPIVKVLTKKPIIPTDDEIQANPRSRSAKLRVVEKF